MSDDAQSGDSGDKKVSLADAPYWGKVVPTQEFEVRDRDGTPIFYIGQFTFPGSNRQEFRPNYYNGREWITKIPPSLADSIPLYNLCEVYDWKGRGDENRDVIIVGTVLQAQMLQDYCDEIGGDYAVVTALGSFKEIRNTNFTDLKDRNVILFPDNTEYSRQWFALIKSCVSPFASTTRMVFPPDGAAIGWTVNKPIAEKDWTTLSLCIKQAYEVPKDVPQVEINELGLSHLEGDLPEMFVNQMIENLGVIGKTGRKVILNNYNSIMELIRQDPAFEHFVKFDEGTGSIIWDTKKYHTIDDVKNAMMRRLCAYRIPSISVQMREDIITSLMNDGNRRINSIKMFFEELVAKHPNADEFALERLFDYVTVDEDGTYSGPNKQMYRKAMGLFFRKACMLILTSGSNHNSIPNDICPVLIGAQGIGKSRFVRYLSMQSRFFVDLGSKGNVSLGSPDCTRMILGKFIAELGEMSVYRKSDVETVKAWISETKDEYTPKFKEGSRKFPRTVSVMGTSNNQEFLKDMTGNRRFFPMSISSVDHVALYSQPEIIEKVWAHYYKEALYATTLPDDERSIVIGAMITQPKELIMYYDVQRKSSVDMGMIGEMISIAIKEIEKQRLVTILDTGRKETIIKIKFVDVARRVFGDGKEFSAQPDFKKRVAYVANELGYSDIREQGTRMIGIRIDETKLLDRMKVDTEVNDMIKSNTTVYSKPKIEVRDVLPPEPEYVEYQEERVELEREVPQSGKKKKRAWD